jgi:hypothetical protein
MPPRSLLATTAALASLAAGAATAHADTYCVAKPTCAAQPGGHAAADLPAALAAAAAHAGADRIEIGPGTFPFPAGGTPVVQSSNDVTEIVGAGRDATILSGGPSDDFALEVEHAGTVVSDLGFALPAGAESRGLDLDAAGAVARRIDVEGPQATSSSQGIGITAGAKLEDARITLPLDTASDGVYVYGSDGATLDRVTIASGYGLRVNSTNGATTVTRSNIKASYRVAYIQSPDTLTIEDSLLQSTTGSYETVGVDAYAAGKATTAQILRSTLVSPGSHPLVDVNSYAANATAKAVLRGVALAGTGAPFGHKPLGVVSVDVDRSAFRTGYAPGPSDVVGTHNLGAPTGFVDAAAGDYRLRFDSPLVDAGGLALLPADAKDLGGGKRQVDGKGDGSLQTDVGAYEYQRRAPVFDAAASTATAAAGTPIGFLMSNVSDPDPGETPALRWEFSDGSTANGGAVQHAFGAVPGGATATAVATDPAGVSTSKAVHVDVVAAPGGGAAGAGGATGGGTAGAGGPAPAPGSATASVLRVGAPRLGADGRLRVRVTCAGTQRCQGTLKLRAGKNQGVALGAKTFSLKAGASATLAVKLGRKARAALPKGRRVRVVATASGRDGAGRTLVAASRSASLKRR